MLKGNCFENSLRFIVDESLDNPKRKLTLVHATVTGTKGYVEGEKYSHAFVIERIVYEKLPGIQIGDPYIDIAIDVSRDYNNPFAAPLDLYRDIGNVHNEVHYCLEEARHMLHLHENFGPWDDRETDFERKFA